MAATTKTLFAAYTNNHAVDHYLVKDLGIEGDTAVKVNCMARSFSIWSYKSTFRRQCIKIAYAKWFSALVLAAILLNSVVLLLDDPALKDIEWLSKLLVVLEHVFLNFFALEMLIKMSAHGLILHEKSYFRDPWNWIDFIVVAAGYIAIALSAGTGVSALRVIRILRPLRSVARVKSLRHILTRLMKSMPRMVDVFILLTFVTWMFGIVGLQFFPGTLHQRCYADVSHYNTTTGQFRDAFNASPLELQLLRTIPSFNPTWELIQNDSDVCTIGDIDGGRTCSTVVNGVYLPQECRVDVHQYQRRVLNFDDMFGAFLLTFKVVCRDNWPDDLMDMVNALGPWVVIFYWLITLFAGYFCVNLFVAVLSNAFSKKDDDEEVNVVEMRSLPMSTVLGAALLNDGVIVAATLRAQKSGRSALQQSQLREIGRGLTDELVFDSPVGSPHSGGGGGEPIDSSAVSPHRGPGLTSSQRRGSGNSSAAFEELHSESSSSSDSDESMTSSQAAALPPHRLVLWRQKRSKQSSFLKKVSRFFRITGWPPMERMVKSLAYTIVILLLVFFNSIILSLDRYNAEQTLSSFIEVSSLIFTVLFLVDALLKLIGLGPSYFRSKSNIVDFLLCVVSIPDLVEGSSSPFTALRAFRLVRLLKLAKNWKGLQHLLRLTVDSLRSVASLSLVALIIIYIYAILGFQLFGQQVGSSRFSFEDNFDSFLTVFVIITGENWASMMQEIMLSKGYLSVLYFASLVIFGNFMLTNLFIAIILENFGETAGGDEEGVAEEDELAIASAEAKGIPPTTRRLLEATSTTAPAVPAVERAELPPISDDDSDASSVEMEDLTSFPPSPQETALFTNGGGAARPNVTSEGFFEEQARAKRRERARLKRARMVTEVATNLKVETGDEKQILKEFLREQQMGAVHIVGDTSTLMRASDTELRKLEVQQNMRYQKSRRKRMAIDVINRLKLATRAARIRHEQDTGGLTALTLADQRRIRHFRTLAEKESQDLQWIGLKHRAWGCIPPEAKLRRWLGEVMRTAAMEWFLLFATVASSVFIALDRPGLHAANPGLAETIFATDIFFAVVFVLEALVKMFLLGLGGHKGAYFRSIWNVIDFIVALTSFLALFVVEFKVGRVLRVLRMLNLSFNLKVIVTALASAIPGMGSVMVLCAFLWWVYAVLGVALYKGRFYYCNDPLIKTKGACIGSYNATYDGAFGPYVEYNVTRRWFPLKSSSSFDGIEDALYSLLKMSLSDSWFEIMYWGVDSTGIDSAPEKNASPFSCLYFITFMIFGNFFIVNLFIGVLVDRFVRHRAEGAGFNLISESQKQWVLSQKVMFRSAIPTVPQCPPNPCRRLIFKWVTNPWFDHFFFFIIIINSVVLSMYVYESPAKEYDDFLYWSSFVIIVLFTVEMFLKMAGLGLANYFRDPWNRLDFLIVVLSWAGFVIGSGADVVRMFRVLRLFLLVRKMKGLQTLFVSLWQAMPELLNVGVVLAVAYYVFAYVGVELFANVRKSSPLNSLVNFDDMGHAFVALYIATTTEGWGEIVDALRDPPECDPQLGDCGTDAAVPFFIVFMIVMAFIMMNLLVTVVIDAFSEAEVAEGQESSFAVLELFRRKWLQFDLSARSRLDVSVILKILPTMPAAVWDRSSLGSGRKRRQTAWQNTLQQLTLLHIPVDIHHEVQYEDVVASLSMRLFCVSVTQGISASQRTPYGVVWKGNRFSVHHHFAAKLITHSVRRWLQTKRERELEHQLRQLRDQHAVIIEAEIEPLRQSHHETTVLARWLLERLAEERAARGVPIHQGIESELPGRLQLGAQLLDTAPILHSAEPSPAASSLQPASQSRERTRGSEGGEAVANATMFYQMQAGPTGMNEPFADPSGRARAFNLRRRGGSGDDGAVGGEADECRYEDHHHIHHGDIVLTPASNSDSDEGGL